jgi:cell division septal protein FtsQ
VREQVIPRTGKVGGAAKARAGVSVQRPSPRRARTGATKEKSAPRQKSFAWKSALVYLPAVLKFSLAVCLGVLAFIGYRTAVSASFFKVRTVDVQGATRASREDIRAAVLRLSNAGVWQSDLSAITGELKSLPWVRDAVVSRVLPDGLRVRVTEREPRVIVRNREGRLVWADDDGVMLGTATPGDEDFLFRGLDEGNTEQVRRDNRARMSVALELKSDWTKLSLSKRVSEVDISDLRDVRVHLAGDDSGIQVVLGGQEYTTRLRQALEKLDQLGRAQDGKCVTYVNVSSGRNATFGSRPCSEVRAAVASSSPTEAARDSAGTDANADASVSTPVQNTTTNARTHDATRATKRALKERKNDAARQGGQATRPRRVG